MIVPSSTSSSSGHWFATWFLALAIVMGAMTGWEVFWRAREFVPSLNDDAQLWSLSRQRANDLGKDAVALVGSSRMQMNIHKETFAEVTGWHEAVQLAAVRGASRPVLESLANDPEFRGTAIVEINPVLFFARTPRIDDVQRGYVRAWEHWTLAKAFEQRLRMWLQGRMVARLPSLAPSNLYPAWLHGRYPRPGYNSVIGEDRFRYGDYYKFANLEMANRLNARVMSTTVPNRMMPGAFAGRMAKVMRWVAQIRGRGGEVIFIHLPSALHVLQYEEKWFSREKKWDAFAKRIDAPTIHYRDHPRLASFQPKDGDHFDRGESMLFAEALGEVLVAKSLAPGRGGRK
jgi:hypothetical protein